MLYFPSPQLNVSRLALLHVGKWTKVWLGNAIGSDQFMLWKQSVSSLRYMCLFWNLLSNVKAKFHQFFGANSQNIKRRLILGWATFKFCTLWSQNFITQKSKMSHNRPPFNNNKFMEQKEVDTFSCSLAAEGQTHLTCHAVNTNSQMHLCLQRARLLKLTRNGVYLVI